MADPDLSNFTARIRALEKGESVAKAERFTMNQAGFMDFNDVLLGMRRTVNTAASRMREATGNNFRVESGMMITTDKDAIIAVVTVTRED